MSTAGETLKDVELFASGQYRGRTYTDDEIDRIAATGKRLGELGILRPPAVKGHEEDGPDGRPTAAPERTDVPADGWVDPASLTTRTKWDPLSRVFRRVLVGTLENVPREMAEAIRNRRFRKVSAEVYDDFKDDSGAGHGPALRRVAFLGGEVPQVKLLADLPMPVRAYCESRPGTASRTKLGTWLTYSEVPTVDEQLKAAILAAMPALNPASLQSLPPDVLADFAKNLPQPPAAAVTPMADPVPAPAFDKAGAVAKLVAAGVGDEASLSAKTDDELKAMVAALPAPAAAPMADAVTDPNDPAKKKPDGVTACSERERLEKIELDAARRRNADSKAAMITAFCEVAVRVGTVLPAQVPFFKAALAHVPHNTVETFAENGKTVTATPLERVLAYGKTLPVVFRFGERVPADDGDPKVRANAEVAKVEKFSELYGDTLRHSGLDPADMVKVAKSRAEKDPKNFKAADLIGKDAVAMVG